MSHSDSGAGGASPDRSSSDATSIGLPTMLVLSVFGVVFGTMAVGVLRGNVSYESAVTLFAFGPNNASLVSLGAHVFFHSDVMHLVLNGALLVYSVKRLLPDIPNEWAIIGLFFLFAVVASLTQAITLSFASSSTNMVGASGGVLGLFALHTTLQPKVEFSTYMPAPTVLVLGCVVVTSVAMVGSAGLTAGEIGHVSHLSGIGLGILTGLHIRISVDF